MVQISFEEYVTLIKDNPYVGYYSCFQASPARHNAPSVVYVSANNYYLFQPNEIGGSEWCACLETFIDEQLSFIKEDQ